MNSTGMSVAQRIKRLKGFLQTKKEESLETGDNFLGEYKSKTGLFAGNVVGSVALPNGIPSGNGNVLSVLNSINNKMELQRIWHEKSNAVSGDINVADYNEVNLASGSQVTFSFQIPEGWVFHIQKLQITYQPLTIYNYSRDSIFEVSLSEFVNDFADQYLLFNPPQKAFSQCEISAINASAIFQVYSCYMGGFLRRYARSTAISEAEENLIQLSVGGAE